MRPNKPKLASRAEKKNDFSIVFCFCECLHCFQGFFLLEFIYK